MPSGGQKRKDKIQVHIKNNRAGDLVFRTTPERLASAEKRHPDVASQVETLIDWDLDRFDESMQRAEVLMTWEVIMTWAVPEPRLRPIFCRNLCPINFLKLQSRGS